MVSLHLIQTDSFHNSTKSGLWLYMELKVQLQCQSSKPPKKIELKEGKKKKTSIMYDAHRFLSRRSKKIKLFQETQIKILEILGKTPSKLKLFLYGCHRHERPTPHNPANLQRTISAKPELSPGGYLSAGEKRDAQTLI